MNIFINLSKNSVIDCNKENNKKIYDLYKNIIHSNKYKYGQMSTLITS